MSKFLRRLLGGFVLICGLLSLTACQKSSQASTQTVKIGILRVPNDVTVARQRQTLQHRCAKQGIKLEFIPFDSGVDANKALLSNSIQMATMGHTNGVVAMAAKIPVKLVWVNDILGSNEALVMRQSTPIRHWSDLRGKKIATPFASTSHYSLMMALKQHHLLGQVELMDMQTTEIVAAWKRGDIDGAYTWEPSLSELDHARRLTDSAQLAQEQHLTANITLATTTFMKQQPEILKIILHCLNDVHIESQHQRQQIYRDAATNLQLTPAAVKKQIGTSRWLAGQEQCQFMQRTFTKQFYQTSRFMWQQQTLSQLVSLKTCQNFIDTQFVPKEQPK